jgi:putative DNA primase/helicase
VKAASTDAVTPPFEAEYDYLDEQGDLLFQVCRRFPKDFIQRRPDGNGGWVYNLNGTRRVLYRLPEVCAHIASNSPEPIYIPEGEKDVEAFEAIGCVATTNPGGALKWQGEYADSLQGAAA